MTRERLNGKDLIYLTTSEGYEAFSKISYEVMCKVAEIEHKLAEAERDTKRMDWCADDRIADQINDVDIDELTLAALVARGVPADCSEDAWRLEWRKQFRVAIDAAMEQPK